MGFAIFVGVVLGLIALMFLVDWLNSYAQQRRINGGGRRSDIDDFKVRDDKIVNASYASFTAKSVKSRNPRG